MTHKGTKTRTQPHAQRCARSRTEDKAPSAKVTRFPGTHCTYHDQGRCLYEERRNPGHVQERRCRVLASMVSVYDRFLDRAEAFDLEERFALGVLERRLREVMLPAVPCPDFVPVVARDELRPLGTARLHQYGASAPLGETLPCVHALEDFCRLALPRCEGVCERFAQRRAGQLNIEANIQANIQESLADPSEDNS